MKTCSRCQTSKDISEFHRVHAAWDGLANYCKPCAKQYSRERGLRSKYDLSVDDYARMLERQDGRCAICLGELPAGGNLAVDHSHDTGLVRGLLCRPCNLALGGFHDSVEILRSAVSYMEAGQ